MEKDEQLFGGRKGSRIRQDRRRVERACDTCRRRKERCNGARPICSNCQNASRDCTYLAEVKRRGLPEGWVRGLEKFWSIAMLQHPDLEKDVLLAVSKALAAPQDSVLSRMWTDDVHDQGLLGRWRNCRLAQELEDWLSQLDSLPQKAFADLEPSNEVRLPMSSQSATPDASRMSEENSRVDPNPEFQHTNLASAVADTPIVDLTLPADTNDRIASYFNYTQVWLPMLQKHEVLRTYHTWSSNHATTTQGDRSCLLAIIDHELLIGQQLQQALTLRNPNSEGDAQLQSFLSPILTQLFSNREEYEVSQAQTLLILTLAKLSNSDIQKAWLYVGAALRIALLMRKELFESGSTSVPVRTHELDRLQRVISGGFVLDGLLATWCQTSPQIKVEEFPMISHLEEDGIDEWSPLFQSPFEERISNATPARSNSAFNRVIEVMKFYIAAHAQPNSSADTATKTTACLSDISAWESSISRSYRWRFALQDMQTPIPPHFLTFHLLHLATLFRLHLSMIQHNPDESSHELRVIHEAFVQFLYRHACDLKKEAIPPIWSLILGSYLRSLLDLCGIEQNVVFAAELQANLTMLSYVTRVWPCQTQLNEQIEQIRGISSASSTLSQPENLISRGTARSEPEDHLYNVRDLGYASTLQQPVFSTAHSAPVQSTGLLDANDVDITEFMTMDAMIWDEPWKQSFQHLGFTDAENTESGLQAFFSNM